MTQTATDRFENCKKENLEHFNFDRIIRAVRATNFGWAAWSQHQTDDYLRQRAIQFAAGVMDRAFEYACQVNEESWSECGGFRATARPNGWVMLQFVLESSWNDVDDEEESNTPQSAPPLAVTPILTGPRRIIQLYKEQ